MILLIWAFIASCGSREMTQTFEIAGDNQSELMEVLHYYSKKDSIYQQAARFLIANMKGHNEVKSIALDSLIELAKNKKYSDEELRNLWTTLSQSDQVSKTEDAVFMSAKDIIDNIDMAFTTWMESPWKDSVSFDLFCNYILPYRVTEEKFVAGWREHLKNQYEKFIEKEDNLIRAYETIHCEIMRRFRNSSLGIPYTAPLKYLEVFGTGSCFQGCAYEVAVMRSLGIPVAIDIVPQWSNYSRNGHAWCALVTEYGSYSMTKHDTVASKSNVIDSSIFSITKTIEDDFPYSTNFKKKVSKVWRTTYERNYRTFYDKEAPIEIIENFCNPFQKDVTKQYVDVHNINIQSQKKDIYLCTFKIGEGWVPVMNSHSDNYMHEFKDMGDSTVYLPVIYDDGIMKPIENPIVITNHIERHLMPDTTSLIDIKLDRKYPLVGKFINRWASMRGAKFEGSNTLDFKNPYLIAEIKRTPVYRNEIYTDSPNKFRYVRYCSPKEINYPLTELEFRQDGKILDGHPFTEGISTPERANDGDWFRVLENATPGYCIGMDFGSPQRIDTIVFYPQNDDNFVKPGLQYELLYYDLGWKKIATKMSNGYSVCFENVPIGALLLLRCDDGGNEERIFTWENGKQVWW